MNIEEKKADKEVDPALPYHPSVADGIIKLTEKSLKLYTEISKNCPLKLWKDRLVAVWGEETR